MPVRTFGALGIAFWAGVAAGFMWGFYVGSKEPLSFLGEEERALLTGVLQLMSNTHGRVQH